MYWTLDTRPPTLDELVYQAKQRHAQRVEEIAAEEPIPQITVPKKPSFEDLQRAVRQRLAHAAWQASSGLWGRSALMNEFASRSALAESLDAAALYREWRKQHGSSFSDAWERVVRPGQYFEINSARVARLRYQVKMGFPMFYPCGRGPQLGTLREAT